MFLFIESKAKMIRSMLHLLLLCGYFHLNLFIFDVSCQTKADSCDSYKHPQYGYGQCIDQSQCPYALYQSGLCESKPTNVKCCFSLATAKEEFRALWITTVTNIDWPSSRTATPTQQQTELINILNTVQRLNMNAVVFQVSDAMKTMVHRSLSLCRFVRQEMPSMHQHWNLGVCT